MKINHGLLSLVSIASIVIFCLLPLVGCGNQNRIPDSAESKADPQHEENIAIPNTTNYSEPDYADTDEPENTMMLENDDKTTLDNGYDCDGGPVFLFSDGDKFSSLKQLNLDTQEFVPVFSLMSPADFQFHLTIRLDADALTGRILEQLFSPDLTKMAINWYVSSDNSSHVGWIDYTGTVTDVTAQVVGTLSDFDIRPKHSWALFSPEGNFFYIDENASEYHVIDPNTFEDLDVQPLEQDAFKVDTRTYERDLMYSPLGTLMPGVSKLNHYVLILFPFADGSGVWDGYNQTGNIADYIGENQVIYAGSHQRGLRRSGNGDGTPDVYNRYSSDESKSVPLLPETDYYISNAAYSNERIVFTAQRGTEKVIFVMDNPPKGTLGNPQRVTDLPPDAKLVFWKDKLS